MSTKTLKRNMPPLTKTEEYEFLYHLKNELKQEDVVILDKNQKNGEVEYNIKVNEKKTTCDCGYEGWRGAVCQKCNQNKN